jgi:hypothetical protein
MCQMHVNILSELIDHRIFVVHVAHIVCLSNACKFLAESIVERIFVWHVARIVWVSNACIIFSRKHR